MTARPKPKHRACRKQRHEFKNIIVRGPAHNFNHPNQITTYTQKCVGCGTKKWRYEWTDLDGNSITAITTSSTSPFEGVT